MKTLSIMLAILLPLSLRAGTIYLTSDSLDGIGAMDENILADDIHLEHSAIITNITMPMCIAGLQTCGLWIFDSLNTPALHHWAFINTASSSSNDFRLYNFSVHAAVPKDFYIGFSAQGDGWDEYDSDHVRGGSSVITGVASNSGIFYYGPVSGGQLKYQYEPGFQTFFTIRIKEAPLSLSGVQYDSGSIEISVTNFFPDTTNHLEIYCGDEWAPVTNFIAGPSGTNWTHSPTNTHALYRLRRE